MNSNFLDRARNLICPLCGFFLISLAAPASAEIINPNPSDGETVTVTPDAPNPATGRIDADSRSDVIINIQPGAAIDFNGNGAAVGGINAKITNDGSITATGIAINNTRGEITNHGTITSTADPFTDPAVVITGDGHLTNTGTITSDFNRAVQVRYGNGNVTNSGVIEAKQAGGTAILFSITPNFFTFPEDFIYTNQLTLLPGSDIRGRVDASGGTDYLVLGGDSGSGTFDGNTIGHTQQYRNFEHFLKEGDGTWTVTGNNSLVTWTINGGTLIGTGSSLGGNIINDGTLVLNQDDGTSYTRYNLISGSGSLTKTGNGTLSLNRNNTYTGGTTLNGGTLALGHDNALGTGDLTVDGDATVTSTDDSRRVDNAITLTPGHALTVDGDRDLSLAGTVSGDGSLIKTGAGVLELSAVNTYTGGTTLRGGTLKLHGGSALGGGSLAVKADSTLASDVTDPVALNHAVILGDADNPANLTFAGTQYFILTGNISGKGNLIQNLNFNILNGSNTFDGDIFLDRGVLQIDNGSSIPDAATVVFSTTADSTLAIYESETVGGLSGGKAGHTGIFLYSPYSAGGKAILTVDNDDDHTYAGSISGADGRLTKAGAGTLTLNGNGSYTGPTTITGGTLAVNGSLASAAIVDGGRLQGSGSIGSLTANRGTVAPGNSIGTLTVNGDVALGSDSVYDVEIHGDGTSDRIAATGNATLAGGTTIDITVVGGADLIRGGDTWDVITADGGVTDDGAVVTSDFAGFEFAGGVVGNAYRLNAVSREMTPTLRNSTARRVAAALDRDADAGNADADLAEFIDATRNRTVADAERALAATDPRTVAVTQQMQQRVTQRHHTTVGDYLAGRRLGAPQMVNRNAAPAAGSGFQLASAAADDPRTLAAYFAQVQPSIDPLRTDLNPDPATNTFDPNWGGFAAAYGVYDDQDARSDQPGSRADTYAGQIGVDYRLSRDLIAGVSFTYAASDLDFDGRNLGNLGSNDIDTYRVGPYLGYQRGPWSADASVTYALHQNDAERLTPGGADSFTADYDSQDIAAYLGGGYTIRLGQFNLTPRAGLQYVHTWTDSYIEDGPGGALDVDDAEFNALRSTLGVNLSRLYTVGDVRLMPHAQVGWAHEFLDDDDVTARFVGGNSPFTLATRRPRRRLHLLRRRRHRPPHRQHLPRPRLPRRILQRHPNPRPPPRPPPRLLTPRSP